MGDPKKHRKKYNTPMHPWQKARIDEERVIRKQFGTRNKKEIWKMSSKLRRFQDLAKKAISGKTKQAEIEMNQLIEKVKKYGLISETEGIDAILDLQLPDIMKRRLQSIVIKKGLANTMLQARQFIVHEHIMIGNKTVNAPSYLVSLDKEGSVNFVNGSPLSDPEHPEREKTKKEEKADQKILEAVKEARKEKKPEKKEEKVKEKKKKKEKVEKKAEEKKEVKVEKKVEEKKETKAEEKPEAKEAVKAEAA
ncbi:MAG: 30S ribosomal protein S4 [Nanoarchaeota archaeon]|nr:30S ribosomal protein S4 [Nanoarchaeota archaeon]